MKLDLANSRQEFAMKSTDICLLLKQLEGKHFTDSGVLEMLQDIRNKVMATKGGVQRLVKAGCVPCLVRLFHRHVHAEGVRDKESQSECGINVAVSILANMFMDSEARSQMKKDGIETLVTILMDTSNEEVQIRCSRALGNLAMDTSAVKTIAQAKALPCLVKLLRIQYIEKDEELVDRILPVSESTHSHARPAEVVQQASAERLDDPVIVEKFPSVALVQAVCRTVRYLADDARVRTQLVEEGVVEALALLLKAEKSEIGQCTLRALFHFWTKMNKRVTERMACEVAQAGAIPNLMERVKSGLNETSQQAFTVLLPLTEHPRTAALIGASGGVTFFLSLHAERQSQFKQTDVVSGLCHLAREAVNRVKIREEAGLRVFLETLQDDRLKAVHDRVISCLLSFLYDDASLNSMLHDGLLDLLLNHLQRCCGYLSQMPVNILEDAELLLTESDPKDCLAGSHFVPEQEVGSECGRSVYGNYSHINPSAEEFTHSKHLHSSVHLELRSPKKVINENAVDSNVESIQSAVENSSETAVKQRMQALGQRASSNSTEEDECENSVDQRDPTYSMNSPTYESKSTWSMEDYHHGVTHKSFAGSGFPYSPDWDQSSPLSPLSTDTYYSPTHVAQFSPPQSSCMSPADTDAAFSPIYSSGGSKDDISEYGVHQECASPKTVFGENPFPYSQQRLALSQQSLSPLSSDSPISNINSGVLLFSSSEDEDEFFVDDTLQSCNTPPPVARREQHGRVNIRSEECESFQHRPTAECKQKRRDTDLMTSGHVSQLMTEPGMKCEEAAQQPLGLMHCVKRFLNMDHSENDCLDKGKASMICQPGKYARTSETNILILLSRISVWDDPSQLLARPAVISCLVNYLSLASQPQDRCERIMSRVMSSPKCLASLLSMCAPAVIVKGCLLQPAKGVLAHFKSLDSSPSTKLQRGTTHFVMQEKDTLHSTVNDDCFSPQACAQHILLSVEMESQASTLLACGQDQGQVLKLARTGLKLLSDLSYQAMSPYGQGIINNTLLRRSPPHQLLFAISLLFLLPQWSTEKQRKLLFHFGTLEKILSALCRSHPTSRITKDVAVMGLVFLLQHLKVASRFEAQKTRHLLQRVIDNMTTEADNNKTDKVPEREMICQTFGTSVDHEFKEMGKPITTSQDGLQTSLKSPCAYATSVKDLQLVTGMCEKIPVNRDALIRNSAMFAAMLKGSYVESKQSEITIQNTNPEALCFVLHFLHGCTTECQVVSYFEQMSFRGTGQSLQNVSESSKDKNNRCNASEQQNTLLLCYNAISIADRFLIPELVLYLDCVLSQQLLNAPISIDVFRFAVFHGLTGLAEDSLLTLLLSHQPLANIAAHVIDLAEGETGSDLVSAMTGLVRRCLPHTG